jgi:RNA polymerase sigma-B factor
MFRRLRRAEPGSMAMRRQREAIIEHCLPLAARLAGRYRHSGESGEDLLQVARLGLMAAVDRFDVEVGSFVAFAVPTILGELRRHFRDHGWAVRVPRRMQEISMRLTDAETVLEQDLHRLPTPSELARHLDVPRAEVVKD